MNRFFDKDYLDQIRQEKEAAEAARLVKEKETAARQAKLTEMANEFVAVAKELGIKSDFTVNVRKHRIGGSVMDYTTTSVRAWALKEEKSKMVDLFDFNASDLNLLQYGKTYVGEDGLFYIYNEGCSERFVTLPLRSDASLEVLRQKLGEILALSRDNDYPQATS